MMMPPVLLLGYTHASTVHDLSACAGSEGICMRPFPLKAADISFGGLAADSGSDTRLATRTLANAHIAVLVKSYPVTSSQSVR